MPAQIPARGFAILSCPSPLAERGRNMATENAGETTSSQEIIEKKHRGIPEATFLVGIYIYDYILDNYVCSHVVM
jgi:hypothetical protein